MNLQRNQRSLSLSTRMRSLVRRRSSVPLQSLSIANVSDHQADLIRYISDPEHPNMTLEQLMVVSAPQVAVMHNHVAVEFTPTVPHCGASTLIGSTLLLI